MQREQPDAAEVLLRAGRFFSRSEVSEDLRTAHRTGGREGESSYRDRWSHDKVVHSTHGVNCTGSCRWKVYAKDGVTTWETQATDHPSVGPDRPGYEPLGCPRGASFSWYSHSPTRVRHPLVRGTPLAMYRGAKRRPKDPVPARADIQRDPARRRAHQQARGKGGLVRASREEAMGIAAAAHVHTIEEHGPDRVAGLSPIPAMPMAPHAAGRPSTGSSSRSSAGCTRARSTGSRRAPRWGRWPRSPGAAARCSRRCGSGPARPARAVVRGAAGGTGLLPAGGA
ncbi:hypothetical protein GCM10010363_11390 [Streptomyces omiyaensis]|nr:hypothetical protein GCM10010363_11390 [Streptomyces omiyaensis]